MSWLIDASTAHHSGVLTHHLGILPALDAIAGDERIDVLAAEPLARALDGRLRNLHMEVMTSHQGAGRLTALNSRVRSRIRAHGPDAVMLGQYAPLRAPGPYVLRMTDAHLIDNEERGRLMRFYTPLQRLGWRVKLAAFRHSVRRAGAVLCATGAVRDQLLAAHPDLDPARVHVAHYGLSPLARPSIRHPGPRGTRLLTMHLSPRKNVETILEAMARPGMEAYELTVLGDMDRPTNPYTRFLAERAASLGVADRVRSVGYIRDQDRLRECLLDHDVLLCPSRIESWSHTVVEGMALGMPVVASDIACHREVSDGAAWLVPPDDADALADAIREAAGGGEAVRARIERGIGVARAYDWTGHAEAMLRALRSAAGSDAGPPVESDVEPDATSAAGPDAVRGGGGAVTPEAAAPPPARLVYIGGTGHSGSTLLDLLLNNHSMIQSTGEVHRLNHYARGNLEPCTCGRPVAECPFWLEVEDRVREIRGLPPESRPLLSDEVMIRTDAVSGWRSAVEKAALVQPSVALARALGRTAAPAHHRAARSSLEWYRAIREATGASVVVDSSKDPRRLKWLYTVAPDHYRLIYLVRDGRAVTASGIRRRGHSMEEEARKWCALQRRSQAVQRSIPREQKLRVKYESLCEDPVGALRQIHEFLGVPVEPGAETIRKEGSHNIGGNAMRLRPGETQIRLDDRWKRELSAEQLAVFDRIAGRLNRRLGYE